MGTTVKGKAGSSQASGRRRAWACLTMLAMLILMVLAQTAPARANTIAGGCSHSLGVKADGAVAAWGYNNYGQVTVPPGLSDIVAVAALYNPQPGPEGRRHRGRLGIEYYGQCNVPAGLTGVAAVAAGAYHSLALKADGTVVAWG